MHINKVVLKSITYLIFLLSICIAVTDCSKNDQAQPSNPPRACINLSRTDCFVGNCTISMDAACSQNASYYSWDFENDGFIDVEGKDKVEVIHTYEQEGTYQVSLLVEGEGGDRDDVLRPIEVRIPGKPTAAFYLGYSGPIIADETNIQFIDNSTGIINNYHWTIGESNVEFYGKEIHNYVYGTSGNKQIQLTVTGPGGEDIAEETLMVHAMNPSCNNYESSTTHNEGAINFIRGHNQLITGRLKVHNTYSGEVYLQLYHPDSWLDGHYVPFGGYSWTVASGANPQLNGSDGIPLIIGNDWGIKVSFANGVTSCIRTVGDIYNYNNGSFQLWANQIYGG